MKKIVFVCLCALTFCLGLGACSNQPLKLKETLALGEFSIDVLSVHLTNLITKEILPDDDTISLIETQCVDVKEVSLCRNVANSLKAKGYAVQEVLPLNERQSGDVEVIEPAGVAVKVRIIPLVGSEYFELQANIKGLYYHRMYKRSSYQVIPVSSWTKAQLN